MIILVFKCYGPAVSFIKIIFLWCLCGLDLGREGRGSFWI